MAGHPPYRRPTTYVPPYAWCDRRCRPCAIDKSKCLAYQRQTDDSLRHVIEGRDPAAPDVVMTDIEKNYRITLELLKEDVRRLGLDLDAPAPDGASPPPAPTPPRPDGPAAAAAGLFTAAAAFLHRRADALRPAFPAELETLSWFGPLVPSRLRAAEDLDAAPDRDAHAERDAILAAQSAHQGLAAVLAALTAVARGRPDLQDELIDVLAAAQAVMRQIESRWLARPCPLLEPVTGGIWWGPLRDVSDDLRRMRERS